MRKALHLIAVAAAVAALAAVTAGLGYAAGTHGSSPRLAVVSRNPLTVTGTHFRAHRTVHLTLTAASTYHVQVRANRHGAFTANFHIVVDRCTQWVVSARQGGLVVRHMGPKPECAPAGTP